jgi:microcystin-dependent protein
MSSPFAGQIMIFAGGFAPAGWAICDGRLLSVEENQQLFNAIGIT